MQAWNVFDTSKTFNVIDLKGLYLFVFKVWGEKYIKVSNMDKFQFYVKVHGLPTYLIVIFIGINTKDWI